MSVYAVIASSIRVTPRENSPSVAVTMHDGVVTLSVLPCAATVMISPLANVHVVDARMFGGNDDPFLMPSRRVLVW